MRIVVCVKQVPDTAALLEVRPGSLRPHLDSVPPTMNPFDEFALEEALRLRDVTGGEVVLLSLATDDIEETIFHGLAMGADRALVLDATGAVDVPVHVTGALLAEALGGLGADLVLCGVRAVDDEAGAVGAMIAESLNVPQITGAERIDVNLDARSIEARRH